LSIANAPLQSIFWTKSEQSYTKKVLLILAGAFLLAFAAQLSIPLNPVPLTFESATVILIGMAYGPRYGAYVIATYLIAGAVGLPVFANFSSGMTRFLGPNGGYLLGFLPAACLSGYLAQRGFAKNVFTSFLAACLGASVIFFFGLTFLAKSFGWSNAIAFGLMPFILSEPIKLAIVALLTPTLWNQQ
jgi:biotin transport system substrate-specific component